MRITAKGRLGIGLLYIVLSLNYPANYIGKERRIVGTLSWFGFTLEGK